jgi:hypothetical protein
MGGPYLFKGLIIGIGTTLVQIPLPRKYLHIATPASAFVTNRFLDQSLQYMSICKTVPTIAHLRVNIRLYFVCLYFSILRGGRTGMCGGDKNLTPVRKPKP